MSKYNLTTPKTPEEMKQLILEALDFYGSEDNGCTSEGNDMILKTIDDIRSGRISLAITLPPADALQPLTEHKVC